MGAIRRHHQNYPDLDAAAYIIGIGMKKWVRQCLLSVDGGCMGSIMPWFAFGFVMSDVLFQDFLSFCARLPQICWPVTGIPLSHDADAFQTN